METRHFLTQLRSRHFHEVQDALFYFGDLFEYGQPISEEAYLDLIRELTDQLMKPYMVGNRADFLGLLESAFYSNNPNGSISTETLVEAVTYIAKTKDERFKGILAPLSHHPRLKPVLKAYFSEIGHPLPD